MTRISIKNIYNSYNKIFSKEYVPNLLNKNKNLKLTGSWKSEVGILDQYGIIT